MKTDVVVVGSGAAGLMAGLAAAERGATVTVLERSSLFGGTSADSAGGMWMPNNPVQARAGIRDTMEDAQKYVRALAAGSVSEELIQAFVRTAPQAVEFLERETVLDLATSGRLPTAPTRDHLPWLPGAGRGRTVIPGPYDLSRLRESRELVRHPVWPGGMPPITSQEMGEFQEHPASWSWVPLAQERIRKGIAVQGHALVAGLLEACLAKRVELISNVRARDLVLASGRATGVVAQQDDKSESYEARLGVVLACGGYEWNLSMWDELIGLPLDGRFSPPLNEGDGLRMAMQAGASLTGLSHAFLQPVVGMPAELYEGKPRLRLDIHRLPSQGSIVVNRRGQRFANEAGGTAEWAMEMSRFDPLWWEFPNLPAYFVFDQLNRETWPLLWHDWSFDIHCADSPDWLFQAPSIRQLAEKVGIDPNGLAQQVQNFNAHAERGEDPVFQRGAVTTRTDSVSSAPFMDLPVRPLGPGPYYAYRLQLGAWGTRGGPIVNGNAQVLDLEKRPIPGLYAVGTTAASLTGSAYTGGSALGPGVTLGYLAGRSLTSK